MIWLATTLALAAPSPAVDEAVAIGAEDPELARELLGWLEDRGEPGAREARRGLPPTAAEELAVAKLVGWQTVAGAWVLGPSIALSTPGWVHPTLTTGGMLAGGALGAGAAVLYARGGRLTTARTTAIVGAQQLGAWNGAALALTLADTRFDPALGATLGLGVGAAGGYLLASLDPPDGPMAAAHTGAFWGVGLGFTAQALFRDDDLVFRDGWIWLLAGSDLGALGGFAVGSAAGLDRGEVRMANVGLALGLVVGGLTVAVADVGGEWSPGAQIGTVAAVGVAGGVGTVAAVRRIGAPGGGGGGGVALAAPAALPTRDGGMELRVLRGHF